MKAKKEKRKLFEIFFKKDRPINSDTIFINGKLFVFYLCSIISALINLIFIANLTRSPYSVGDLFSIPAALFLGILSIGLDLSKIMHVIQVNTLRELARKLNLYKQEAAKKIRNLARKWNTVYLLYVALSILTSVSLSTISIGSGITKNRNLLKQIDEMIQEGEKFYNVDSAAKDITMKSYITEATDNSERDAIQWVSLQSQNTWPKIEEYQKERVAFEKISRVSSEEEMEWNGEKIIPNVYWDNRNSEMNALLSGSKYSNTKLTGRQIASMSLADFERKIKANYLATYKATENKIATEKLNVLTSTTMEEAYNWIITLNDLQFYNPKSEELVIFDTDKEKQTKILVSAALMRLKALRVDIENDSGDIGSSSKIFLQIGSLFEKEKTNTLEEATNVKSEKSFGATEIMIMATLLFLSLLCELAINQFSPKTRITRKMLYEFSQYFPADFDVNEFMLSIYLDQFTFGAITKNQFDKYFEETNSMQEYSQKKLTYFNPEKRVFVKQSNEYSSAVDEKIKEIEDILRVSE